MSGKVPNLNIGHVVIVIIIADSFISLKKIILGLTHTTFTSRRWVLRIINDAIYIMQCMLQRNTGCLGIRAFRDHFYCWRWLCQSQFIFDAMIRMRGQIASDSTVRLKLQHQSRMGDDLTLWDSDLLLQIRLYLGYTIANLTQSSSHSWNELNYIAGFGYRFPFGLQTK